MRSRLFCLIKSGDRLLDAPCRLALLSAQRLANDFLATLVSTLQRVCAVHDGHAIDSYSSYHHSRSLVDLTRFY